MHLTSLIPGMIKWCKCSLQYQCNITHARDENKENRQQRHIVLMYHQILRTDKRELYYFQ